MADVAVLAHSVRAARSDAGSAAPHQTAHEEHACALAVAWWGPEGREKRVGRRWQGTKPKPSKTGFLICVRS